MRLSGSTQSSAQFYERAKSGKFFAAKGDSEAFSEEAKRLE